MIIIDVLNVKLLADPVPLKPIVSTVETPTEILLKENVFVNITLIREKTNVSPVTKGVTGVITLPKNVEPVKIR